MIAIWHWLEVRTNRFFLLLLFFLTGLLFSKALLSMSVALLTLHWIIDPLLKVKLKSAISNKALIAFLSIFLIHIVALIHTSDFQYALLDLKIKLPLFLLPLIFATEQKITGKQYNFILDFFFLVVILSTFISLVLYLGNSSFQLRSISPFMSHIRFGIVTTIASAFLFYQSSNSKSKTQALIKLLASLWLALFTTMILGSVNGVILFTTLLIFWISIMIFKTKRKIFLFVLIPALILITTLPLTYIIHIHNRYFPQAILPQNEPEALTLNGNAYVHEHHTPEYENGIPIYGYYCKVEFISEWNKRSNMKLEDSTVFSPVGNALVRYLSSKNLPKDSLGVAMLSNEDIENIEKGIPNYSLAGKTPLEYRLYELFRGYYFYKNFDNPNNNSLFMRLEFWKTAFGIIKENPVFGVGTGDVNSAFDKQYEKTNSRLEHKWRLRAHNQFISFTVAFGVVGLIIFLFALFYPPLKLKKFSSFYFVSVFLVLLLSMISEDTIETQIGVSIFSFFFSFFLFITPKDQSTPTSNHK